MTPNVQTCSTVQYQAGHLHTCTLNPHPVEVQHKCDCDYRWTDGRHATTCRLLIGNGRCDCGAEK